MENIDKKINSRNSRIMRMILLKLLILILIQSSKCDIKSNRTYVVTPMGTVEGYYERSWKNRSYKSFMGIPYAQPPIEELRFEAPVPLSKWDKTIQAIFPPPPCPQNDKVNKTIVQGEEDCLYLNIYIPVTNKNITLPVLFWIHGGGFRFGTSSKYKAKYLMDRDIILVTINYRLGPLGFLSTGDHIIPGNMGLKDQNLALRWVSENIKYFQGDPNKVTLAGESTGAASVHYHYLSPMSNGLFQSGISFSGCALNPWAFKEDISDRTRNLAYALECPVKNTESLSKCLKNKSMKQIIQTSRDIVKNVFSGTIFVPVSEKTQNDYFINSAPIYIIKSGNISDVPWLTGFVKDEGLLVTAGIYTNDEWVSYLNEKWEIAAADILYFFQTVPRSKWSYLLALIRKHYLGSEPISKNTDSIKKLTRLIGDYRFSIGQQRAAKLQAGINKSPVNFYYYTYRAATSCINIGPNKHRTLGVTHTDDIALVFEMGCMDPTTTENDRAMLEEVLNNWYSVIVTHKPNLGIPWLDIGSSQDFQYMQIAGPGKNKMEINNNLSDIKFWNSIGL